jgi:hypothetical protein
VLAIRADPRQLQSSPKVRAACQNLSPLELRPIAPTPGLLPPRTQKQQPPESREVTPAVLNDCIRNADPKARVRAIN